MSRARKEQHRAEPEPRRDRPASPRVVPGREPTGDPARTEEIVALQRSAGNAAVAGLLAGRPVQRQGAEAPVMPAVTIELPEFTYALGKASFITGSVGSKGRIVFQPVSSAPIAAGYANQGGKVDFTLGKQEAIRILGSVTLDEIAEVVTFELSRKRVDVSFRVTGKLKTSLPFISGLVEGKFTVAGVKWEEPDSVTAFGFELSGGFTGEGPIRLGGVEVMVKPRVTLTGTARPNWPRILSEAGRQAAQGIARGAATAVTTEAGTAVTAVSLAELASAAATVAPPVAAALGMGYGVFQGMRNTEAAVDAAGHGVALRRRAQEFAEGYARTLTGGAGAGPGAAEAERQLRAITERTGAIREMAVAAVRYEQGSYEAIYDRALRRVRDAMYTEAVRQFDESHEADFGLLERIGEDWGMRGTFRTNLRLILYSE